MSFMASPKEKGTRLSLVPYPSLGILQIGDTFNKTGRRVSNSDLESTNFSTESSDCSLKLINSSGYLAIVITNQPVIARGEVTVPELELIHQKMTYAEWAGKTVEEEPDLPYDENAEDLSDDMPLFRFLKRK